MKKTPLAAPAVRRYRWFQIQNRFLRGLGWLITFKCFGLGGVVNVFAWSRFQSGRKPAAILMFTAALVFTLASELIQLYLAGKLFAAGTVALAPRVGPELEAAAILLLVGLCLTGIWERMLAPAA